MPAFEVGLPLGAVALYLFDSSLLLYSNELIFLHRARAWSWAQGSPLLLAGRRVYFPNPLAPGTPAFRVRWSEADPRQQQEDGAGLDRFFRALRPVQYLVNALVVILLVLPVELLLFGAGVELLVVMAAFYLVILATLSYIYVRRGDLLLSGRSFVALCFDSLACAPFAINLARKLALRRGLAGNPIAFAARAFEPATVAGLIHAVAGRVSEEQFREDGQSARWTELEAYRQRLSAMVSGEPREGPG
jgi:hypothetical protein